MAVYSFDIFDTLVTRETATPRGIFLIVQYRLRNEYAERFPAQLVEEFFHIRLEAEDKARAECAGEECTFASIYARIQSQFGLSETQAEFLGQIELQSELDHVVGIPGNIERARRLLDQGSRVVLISDTYLSKAFLRSLLAALDAHIADCPMYVSSEQGVAKHTGNLFRLVLQEERITAGELYHVGENRGSDYALPRRLGINAELFDNVPVSEYEIEYFAEDRLYLQLLAGVSKNYRLLHPDATPLERIGACLAGPLFYGYVENVLQQALRDGVNRIYFLARDGQILLKIAQIIKKKKRLKLELRYLHVSRQVCYLASVFQLTQRETYWFRDFMQTFAYLARRLNADPEELFRLVPVSIRSEIGRVDQRLSKKSVNQLCDVLMADNALSERIQRTCADFRSLFLDYLRQQGLFDAERSCMVDVGWSGKAQDGMYKVIAEHDPSMILECYYFGMLESGWSRYSPYTSLHNRKRPYIDIAMKVRTHVTFIEMLAAADHGTTLGYSRDSNGTVLPLLDSSTGTDDWGLADYQEAACWFSMKFCVLAARFSKSFNYHRDIVPLILKQATCPSREVAECLGDLPYTLGHDDTSIQHLAPPLSLADILAWSINRDRRLASWLDGALQRSPRHVRWTFHCLVFLRLRGRGVRSRLHVMVQVLRWKLRDIYRTLCTPQRL